MFCLNIELTPKRSVYTLFYEAGREVYVCLKVM